MSVSQSDFACPRCLVALAAASAPDVTLHGCPSCGGIWLNEEDSQKAVDGLASPTVDMVKAAGQNATQSPDSSGWVACPECSKRMERNHFGPANVEVAYCPEHGTWFDEGELLAVHRAAMGEAPAPTTWEGVESSIEDARPQNATQIFILGLLGLVLCQLLAPFAWRQGNDYERMCAVAGATPDGLATAGKVMGIIGTVLLGLNLVCGCMIFFGELAAVS